MTTPGATEAVTPEQDAGERGRRLMNQMFNHVAGLHPWEPCAVCLDIFTQALREAEANALRRAAELAEYEMAIQHQIVSLDDTDEDASSLAQGGEFSAAAIARAIRSLLPKEEGQAPDAPR